MAEFAEGVFGRIAIRLGYLTETQVEQALAAQAAGAWDGHADAAAATVPVDAAEPAPLGVLLVERGWLTPEQAAQILREQPKLLGPPPDARGAPAAGRRFGQLAVALGLAAPAAVNRARAVQARAAGGGVAQRRR